MRKIIYIAFCFFFIAGLGYCQQKGSLRIMSYNIRIGIGMDQTTNLDRIADVIRKIDPDYVGLQEVDSVAERSQWVDQVRVLADKTGMYPIFAPATKRSKGLYGIAALSKKPPLSYKNTPLPGNEEPRTFLVLEYNNYILCNTHFSLDKESRMESIKIINESVKHYQKPVLITGDFNMLPQSDEFEAMSQDWTLLSDSLPETYPSDKPRMRLDYIFGHKNHTYEVSNHMVVDVMASDHLPIYIDIKNLY